MARHIAYPVSDRKGEDPEMCVEEDVRPLIPGKGVDKVK